MSCGGQSGLSVEDLVLIVLDLADEGVRGEDVSESGSTSMGILVHIHNAELHVRIGCDSPVGGAIEDVDSIAHGVSRRVRSCLVEHDLYVQATVSCSLEEEDFSLGVQEGHSHVGFCEGRGLEE